jgi:hypothetical protein
MENKNVKVQNIIEECIVKDIQKAMYIQREL